MYVRSWDVFSPFGLLCTVALERLSNNCPNWSLGSIIARLSITSVEPVCLEHWIIWSDNDCVTIISECLIAEPFIKEGRVGIMSWTRWARLRCHSLSIITHFVFTKEIRYPLPLLLCLTCYLAAFTISLLQYSLSLAQPLVCFDVTTH